jgi:hypothetical protein
MNYLRDPRIMQLARRRRVRIGRRGFLGLGLAAILGAVWRGQALRPGRGRWVLRKDDV